MGNKCQEKIENELENELDIVTARNVYKIDENRYIMELNRRKDEQRIIKEEVKLQAK